MAERPNGEVWTAGDLLERLERRDTFFVVDVRKVATQASDLLDQTALGIGHELLIALIPELVTVRDRPGDTAAVGLDRVFRYQFRLERRELVMPIHDLWFVAINGSVHMTPPVEDVARRDRALTVESSRAW